MNRNRFRISMTALAVTGSLAFGVAPVAMAQGSLDSDQTSQSAAPSSAAPTDPTKSEEPKSEEPKPEEPNQEDPTKISLADEAFSRLQTDFNAYTLAGPNQPTYYRHHCGVWVTDQNRIGSDVALTKAELEKSKEIEGQIRADIANRVGFGSPALDGASTVEDPSPIGASVECTIADDQQPTPAPSDKFDPRVLGIILPATLIIGGIVWHLMQDGKTYTQDQAHVNKQPTEEEKNASNEMLTNNADEVKKQAQSKTAQGGATAGAPAAANQNASRGMLAETGNNTVARGLFALVLLSVIGAAAFVARRRFTA